MNFKRYNGRTWETVRHKIYGSGTDSLTAFPAMIQASGEPLTDYLISGNTVQNGTPTPEAPVEVLGCGVRTENLFDKNAKSTANGFMQDTMLQSDGTTIAWNVFSVSEYIPIESGAEYYLSDVMNAAFNAPSMCFYDSSKQFLSSVVYQARNSFGFSAPAGAAYVRISYMNAQADSVMLNLGSTALPYEPYGYKIPITCGEETKNIYLWQVETTRRIGKIDLSGLSWSSVAPGLWKTTGIPNIKYVSVNTEVGDGIAEKYTIHTGAGMTTAPHCIAIDVSQVSVNTGDSSVRPTGMFWYVLAEPETGIVNEPLHKIGGYADTITMEQAGVTIPTSDGDNTITFGTSVQPSAMSATFKWWHPVQSAKVYDGNDWS